MEAVVIVHKTSTLIQEGDKVIFSEDSSQAFNKIGSRQYQCWGSNRSYQRAIRKSDKQTEKGLARIRFEGNKRNTRELIQKVIKTIWQGREKDANT